MHKPITVWIPYRKPLVFGKTTYNLKETRTTHKGIHDLGKGIAVYEITTPYGPFYADTETSRILGTNLDTLRKTFSYMTPKAIARTVKLWKTQYSTHQQRKAIAGVTPNEFWRRHNE